MGGIRVVIVDDSSFSIALIRGILEDNGFEVVGEAGNLDEVKLVVESTKPDLVTMDMTLPGTDGFECTRAVHEISRKIKVIMISSLMDDESIKEAKHNNIAEYVQKPVDPEALISAINKVMSVDELFLKLNDLYFPTFKEGFVDGINKMTRTLSAFIEEYQDGNEMVSKGITIIISIIGKFSGRMLLDMDDATAAKLTTALLKGEPKSKEHMMGALAEFSNIIAGNSCSMINRMDKSYALRIAPPSLLHGENVHISAPNNNAMTGVAETEFGKIILNIGFERGEV